MGALAPSFRSQRSTPLCLPRNTTPYTFWLAHIPHGLLAGSVKDQDVFSRIALAIFL